MPVTVRRKNRVVSSSARDEPQPSTSNGHSRSRRIPSSSSSEASESDENHVPGSKRSKSSRGRSRVDQAQVEMPSAEVSRLVADCAFYLLVADQRKYAIKKSDIIKNVLKENRKSYKIIIKKVEEYLKQTAGIKLVELQSPKGQYILINDMKNARSFAQVSRKEKMKLGFTMTVLSLIFMKEDFMLESDMWKALKKIGIDPDTKHPVFGDTKKLLTQDLVRQLYVEYKLETSDPPVYIFCWGPRAKLELSKLEVLQFVCDIFGDDMTPQQWPSHYKTATRSEQLVGGEE